MGICLGSGTLSESAVSEKLGFPNLPIWTAVWGVEGAEGLGEGAAVVHPSRLAPAGPGQAHRTQTLTGWTRC